MASQKSYTDRIKALVSRAPGAMPMPREESTTRATPPAGATDEAAPEGGRPKDGAPTAPIIFSPAKGKGRPKTKGISIAMGRKRGVPAKDWRMAAVTLGAVLLAIVSLVLVWMLAVVNPRQRAQIAEQEAQLVQHVVTQKELQTTLQKKEEELVRIQSAVGVVKVESEPPGALVTLSGKSGVTPFTFETVPTGEHVLGIELEGYEPVRETIQVADAMPLIRKFQLAPCKGGLVIETDPPGANYRLLSNEREVRSGRSPDRLAGLPIGEYQLHLRKGEAQQQSAVRIAANQTAEFRHRFVIGQLRVDSTPPGADVRLAGRSVGTTPLLLGDVPAGPVEIELRLGKFLPKRVQAEVIADRQTPVSEHLEPNLGPPPGKDFTAASGLDMVWTDPGYWVSRYELTQAQYQALAGSNPSQSRGGLRPVDSVSWRYALNFCSKLTQAEDAAETLPSGFRYTLPTEAEWNQFAGAPPNSPNIGVLGSTVGTSEVTRTPANGLGLRGVWGNVWEWCSDAGGRGRVLCGGGWSPIYDGLTQVTGRTTAPEDEANPNFGFRVILKRR